MKPSNETDVTDSPAAPPVVACSDLLGEPHLTLTITEIRDLAGMCGLVVKDATAKEKDDERETEITITPWPASGIKDENGKPYAHAHKHLAYFEEYPEEGCVPLGSPNIILNRNNCGFIIAGRSVCMVGFFNCGFYHVFMKPDLRISIKE